MKILTWNINGIRKTRKDFVTLKSLLDSLDADIICLQETKITRNLLTEDIANVDGYFAFFSFCRTKGGYSGVATFCKKHACPHAAEEGLTGILYKNNPIKDGVGSYDVAADVDDETLKAVDYEGRAVITEHKLSSGEDVCLLNVYCPCVHSENFERHEYKMMFNRFIEKKCRALLKAGKQVMVAGDINISHQRIDHCDPEEDFEQNESRKWLDSILITHTGQVKHVEPNQEFFLMQSKLDARSLSELKESEIKTQVTTGILVDLFRYFNPNKKSMYTCWNTKSRARETNYGTRIDYILVSAALVHVSFTACRICVDIKGSDHCPVVAEMSSRFVRPDEIPSLCAINMPEISGQQQTIKSFFSKATNYPKIAALPKEHSLELSRQDVSKRRKHDNKKEADLLAYFPKTSSQLNNIGNFKTPDKTNKYGSGMCKHGVNNISGLDNFSGPVKIFEKQSDNTRIKSTWKLILTGPSTPPLCSGHKEPAVLRTVKKQGTNFGRQFYVCNRPPGQTTDKDAECGYFAWKSKSTSVRQIKCLEPV